MPRHFRLLLSLTLCVFAVPTLAQREASGPPKPVVGRSKVATKYGIVAASQPLAARAGVQILERGGNAIDAAIAANAVDGARRAAHNGIGGDLFAIYLRSEDRQDLRAERRRLGADRVDAGAAATRRASPTCRQRHLLASPCPAPSTAGTCCARASARCRCRDLLAPAIFYAEDGFPVTDVIADAWNALREAARRIRTPRRRFSSTAARRAPAKCSRTRCSPRRCA